MNVSQLRKIDLNLLTVFGTIAETRSITLTAQRLFLTQSAVSHALRRLRVLFADPLFVREANALVPTPHAIELAAQLMPLMESVDALVRSSGSFDPTTARREFRVGLPNALVVCLVPGLLNTLAAHAPHCSLVVRPTSAAVVTTQLDEDDVDLAMTVMGKLKPWHVREAAGRFGYLCLFDPQRMRGDGLSLADFVRIPHLLTSFKGDRWGVVDAALEARGLSRRVVCSAGDFASVATCLKSIDAVAVLPAYAALAFARLLGLRTCPVPLPIPPLELSVAWHGRRAKDPALGWFREVLGRVAASELGVATGTGDLPGDPEPAR